MIKWLRDFGSLVLDDKDKELKQVRLCAASARSKKRKGRSGAPHSPSSVAAVHPLGSLLDRPTSASPKCATEEKAFNLRALGIICTITLGIL